MKKLTIFCNTSPGPEALNLLETGTAPHLLTLGTTGGLGEADVAFGQPNPGEALQSHNLRWMHLSSAGYTRYDNDEFRKPARARGLQVTNSSSVYESPCAEHLFAFMMAHSRGLPLALKTRCANGSPEWSRLRYSCRSLSGQSVVILGFGAIAKRLIQLLAPFKMTIEAFRRKPSGAEEVPMISLAQLPGKLALADHVINILPENADSLGFFSSERLASLKPGAVFYNIGRGGTVDQLALVQALQSGPLAAAWLDVTDPEPLPQDHPLWAIPNCHITPHIGGGRHEEGEALVKHFLKNFQLFLSGSPLLDRVI